MQTTSYLERGNQAQSGLDVQLLVLKVTNQPLAYYENAQTIPGPRPEQLFQATNSSTVKHEIQGKSILYRREV